jgi:hypothetical protein
MSSESDVGIPFCRDSPYLQRALLDQEEYVKALGKYLGDVAKEMKSFNKGLIISINSAVSLAQKMKAAQNIRGDYDVGKHSGITSSGLVQLEPVLARFSEVLFEIAVYKLLLLTCQHILKLFYNHGLIWSI